MRYAALFTIIAILATVPANAAGPFDGVYKGSATVAKAAAGACPPGREVTIRVRDGIFHWGGAEAPREITIGQDGRFANQLGKYFITGQVAGNHFEAQSGGERCEYHISADKS